jgi:hypothetical protein
MVNRSAQTGTRRVRITVPLPTFAPSARSYSGYIGVPANSTIGFDCAAIRPSQNRK